MLKTSTDCAKIMPENFSKSYIRKVILLDRVKLCQQYVENYVRKVIMPDIDQVVIITELS